MLVAFIPLCAFHGLIRGLREKHTWGQRQRQLTVCPLGASIVSLSSPLMGPTLGQRSGTRRSRPTPVLRMPFWLLQDLNPQRREGAAEDQLRVITAFERKKLGLGFWSCWKTPCLATHHKVSQTRAFVMITAAQGPALCFWGSEAGSYQPPPRNQSIFWA